MRPPAHVFVLIVVCSQENILVRGDVACVGDVQVATIITDPALTTQHSTTTCRGGVVRYIAPEQANPNARGRGITKKTDVYSFAITAYRVCSFTPKTVMA